MTFYQELQLSSVGSKQLNHSTTDKKEKRRHILIYNFKVYLVMAFCVAVVTLYSMLAGNENSVVGVTVLLALLVLRQADFGIRTTHGLLSIMGIFAILMAGPRLANVLPAFGDFAVNTISIFLLMILGCHNVIMYNHSTFVWAICFYMAMMSLGMRIRCVCLACLSEWSFAWLFFTKIKKIALIGELFLTFSGSLMCIRPEVVGISN